MPKKELQKVHAVMIIGNTSASFDYVTIFENKERIEIIGRNLIMMRLKTIVSPVNELKSLLSIFKSLAVD